MGKIISCFFCAIFCFSFLGSVFAQTVILKSGQKVEGKIIEQNDKYVKLDFQGVELTFYNDEIFSIEQTSADGVDAVSPQMELLYKSYTASLNPAQSQVKEEAGEEVKEVAKEEDAEAVKSPPKLPAIIKRQKAKINLATQ